MSDIKPGDRVQVAAAVRDTVICDHIDNIAGKVGHVINVYKTKTGHEAFVVAHPLDEEGSYVPLEFLAPIE